MTKTFPSTLLNYPQGGSFGALFLWHLGWGTRPGCSTTQNNRPWEPGAFYRKLWPGTDLTKYKRKFANWREPKSGFPNDAKIVRNIEILLFGNDSNLNRWRSDLRETWSQSHSTPYWNDEDDASTIIATNGPSGRQAADTSGSIAHYFDPIVGKIDIGFAEIKAMLEARLNSTDGEELEAQIRRLQDDHSATLDLIRTLLIAAGKAEVPDNQLLVQFENQITAIVSILSEARRPSNIPEIAVARATIKDALEKGDLGAADRAYSAAATSLKERRMSAALEESEMYSGRAKIALARLDEPAAADLYATAAELAAPFDVAVAQKAREAEAEACLERGHQTADIQFFKRAVRVLREVAEVGPFDHRSAFIYQKLAGSLCWIAEMLHNDESIDLFTMAINAYETSCDIAEKNNDRYWLINGKKHVGQAQRDLGELLIGDDGQKMLESSIKSLREVVENYGVWNNSIDGMEAYAELGWSICTLGCRLSGDSSEKLLRESIEILRESSSSWGSYEHHSRWTSQRYLGSARLRLGRFYGGQFEIECMSETILEYQSFIELVNFGSFQWFSAQSRLGHVLRRLGNRLGGEAGVKLLRESLAAFDAAISWIEPREAPNVLAISRVERGVTLRNLASQLEGGDAIGLLREAIEISKLSILDLPPSPGPYGYSSIRDWTNAQDNLAKSLVDLGGILKGQAGVKMLGEAVAVFEDVLAAHPLSGKIGKSRVFLFLASDDWAVMQCNRGDALRQLGVRVRGEGRMKRLQESITAFGVAHSAFVEMNMLEQAADARESIDLVRKVLMDKPFG
jgi:tetratricopeptide (TPR) repeat protein